MNTVRGIWFDPDYEELSPEISFGPTSFDQYLGTFSTVLTAFNSIRGARNVEIEVSDNSRVLLEQEDDEILSEYEYLMGLDRVEMFHL